MIKILAPQTRAEADAGATVVLEMDRATMLGAAVEVAYDDPDSVPAEFKDVGSELWEFFAAGRQVDGDVPFLP